MFGIEDEFKELCKIVESKGIKIILDVVFSYISFDSKYFNKFGNYNSIGVYQLFNFKYYDWYKFFRYLCQYELWWGIEERFNVNVMNEEYIDYIINSENFVIKKWMEFGVSGWKLNVIDEFLDEFIELIRKRIQNISNNIVFLGDVWDDVFNKVSYFKRRKYLMGKEIYVVINYLLRESLINFIKGYIKLNKFKRKIMFLYENYLREIFYGNINIIGMGEIERILIVLDGNLVLLKLMVVI